MIDTSSRAFELSQDGGADQAPPSALSCDHVSVAFGAVQALKDVSLGFTRGGIHAVVGQNGAGKSTLARVLSGMYDPDAGQIFVDGVEATRVGVKAMRARGVEIVHQNLALPPSLTIAEALELFAVDGKRVYARRAIEARWAEELKRFGVTTSLRTKVRDLPIETAQAVEICRTLATNPSVLILDEPTAVLSPQAAEALFDRVRLISGDGFTVVIILHKLREVRAIADRVSVLRHGEVQLADVSLTDIDDAALADHIVDVDRTLRARPRSARTPLSPDKAPGLSLHRISTHGSVSDVALQDIAFDVHVGEIVGIAGVEGNGQRPLLNAIAGFAPLATGSIAIGGRDVTSASVAARRRAGLRFVPFDRNVEGASQTAPVWKNVAVLPVVLRQARSAVAFRPRALRDQAEEALRRWEVRFGNADQPARELSGGNLQRLIFARELSGDVKVLLAAQPTRGLDLAATAFVYSTLRQLRDDGTSLLLVSSDLDELIEVCDRILVVLGGRLAGEVNPPFDLRAVSRKMLGIDAAR